jgi:hypothetical protein
MAARRRATPRRRLVRRRTRAAPAPRWWAERTDYDWTTDASTGDTSDYTQMVSSNIYAVGCATQKCGPPGPGGWDDTWWWTMCEYGPRGQAYWVGTKELVQIKVSVLAI